MDPVSIGTTKITPPAPLLPHEKLTPPTSPEKWLTATTIFTHHHRQLHARALRANLREPRLWNTIARGYTSDNALRLALMVCIHMPAKDNYTFPLAFRLCSLLSAFHLGFSLHASLVKLGLAADVHSLNALLSLHCGCGQVQNARKVFDAIPDRIISSWTAMVSGYERNSDTLEAVSLFCRMCEGGKVEPDEAAVVSVLAACSQLGWLRFGEAIHARAVVGGLGLDLVGLGTALVDMYAKAGAIAVSKEVFARMPRRNVLSWSAMIGGLALSGRGVEALELFEEMMMDANLRPTTVTMTNVLSACSHSGLVEEGRKYFELMKNKYGIEPRIEHYGCMVDLLGRAGLLRQAYEFIRAMPIAPSIVLWRSLLGSACTHGDLVTGELAMDSIAELEHPIAGDYVMLANLYARFGRWEDVGSLRTLMNDSRLRKEAGYSSVEVNGKVHKFVMGDRSHSRKDSIYQMLGDIDMAIRKENSVNHWWLKLL